MEFTGSRHKRMKSDLGKKGIYDDKYAIINASQSPKVVKGCKEADQWRSESIKTENSLKQEIEQLQKQLEDQLVIRTELEKATNSQPLLHDPIDEPSLTKSSKDLIKEISILELEVKHLEKYLLSLYRKTFQKREQSVSATDTKSRLISALKDQQSLHYSSTGYMPARASTNNPPKEFCPILESKPMEDSYVNRSHSSLSYRTPPLYMAVNQVVESYHSLPLGMF